jgi:hypothetical protein
LKQEVVVQQRVTGLIAVALLAGACGDPEFTTNPHPTTSPTIPVGVVTTGFVSAQIDEMPFSTTLLAASVVRNGRFGFGMSIPEFGDLIFSVSMPAQHGEWEVGSSGSPFATVATGLGSDAERWVASFAGGTGSVTVFSIMDDQAEGQFHFELVPDSATARAGVVATRMVTSGTFNVRLMR